MGAQLHAVFLDVGETLVNEDRYWREVAAAAGLSPHVVTAALGVTIARGEDHTALWSHLGVERPESHLPRLRRRLLPLGPLGAPKRGAEDHRDARVPGVLGRAELLRTPVGGPDLDPSPQRKHRGLTPYLGPELPRAPRTSDPIGSGA